ncbi:hypothetical protein ACFSWD_20100 [Paenibacillus xanthanilyticus]
MKPISLLGIFAGGRPVKEATEGAGRLAQAGERSAAILIYR